MASSTKKTLGSKDKKALTDNYDVIVFSKSRLKKLLVLVLILILVGAIGIVGSKYNQARQETKKAQEDVKRLSDPNVSAKATEDELIEKVKKVALVPDDEKPTIANIPDDEKLKNQPLFALVQKGDKLLYYPKARRQVVYRPSSNQVITVVTLPAESPAEVPKESSTETAPAAQ